jgi:protocatechuate 3,4-dioxygenase beta subunit
MRGSRKSPPTSQTIIHPSDDPPPGYISRRGILVVAGTGLAGTLVGCTTEVGAKMETGGAGGSEMAGGEGGGSAGGTGGGAGGRGGSGAAGAGGSGGGSAGNGGGAMADAGGGGVDAGASGSADAASFRDGATIEAGNPQGMVDGATAACRVTARDQLGPYYKDGHLERAVMAGPNDGMKLIVSGRVLNTKCQPLSGAVVDVWSANGSGVYSEQGAGWCRGFVKTDGQGGYRYEIVYPGKYQGRPRHLHVIISQPGYSKVTTQMYFKGEDPDIEANAVPKVMMNGAWHSQWDIVLAGGGMAAATSPRPQPREIPRRFWGPWYRPSKSA